MMAGWLLLLAGAGMVGGMVAFRFPRLWLTVTLAGAGTAFAAAVTGLVAAARTPGGGPVWDWQPGMVLGGQAVHLQLDGLSAFFLVLLSVLGAAGTLYSSEYWTDRAHPASAPPGRA